MQMSREEMKRRSDEGARAMPQWKKGDRVWLDARNIQQKRASNKLSAKKLGPFEVVEKVGSNAYRIKLPPTMKGVHPVFNVALLHDAPPDAIPGRVHKQPPPVEVEGQE